MTSNNKNVSVDKALEYILKGAPTTNHKVIDLKKAQSRVLAQDIVAQRDQPPFNASAMDGYAIALKTDDPETRLIPLRIIGESQAGKAYRGEVRNGEAIRIFTGAPVPQGANHVIMQENTQTAEGRVLIMRDGWNDCKTHIRSQGFDFKAGDGLLPSGTRLDAWRLSLVAAAGFAQVKVARKPRIAIVCTGDELVAAGTMPRDDQIFESTSHALMALAKDWGAKPFFVGVKKDSIKSLVSAFEDIEADLIVTVGGASVGDYDLVRPALEHLGLELDFAKVDIRPGKPTSFGKLGDSRRVLSLPGNPASALVCAQIFLKPYIEQVLQLSVIGTTQILPSAKALAPNGARETYLRANIILDEQGLPSISAFDEQDSSLIKIFSQTNGLIRRLAGAKAAPAGHLVEFIPLRRL